MKEVTFVPSTQFIRNFYPALEKLSVCQNSQKVHWNWVHTGLGKFSVYTKKFNTKGQIVKKNN